jgi:predicted pyridoxine 5'-phosphate oxidase superfamily flavin-nucleotide-binding protein
MAGLVDLTDDMRAVVESAHLAFVATVTPDGLPHLSPKGTIRVLDRHRLYFLDIASPGTRRNLGVRPWMEINVIDALSRRGYRFFGAAAIQEGEVAARACARVFEEEGARFDVAAVVVLEVHRALSLVSPGYLHVRDERAMRSAWRAKRRGLDRAFEAHLRHNRG